MLVTKLGKRYAKSLLELARELNVLEEVHGDMQSMLKAVNESRELRTFLKSPIVEHKKKVAIIETVFQGQLHEPTKRFIALMAKQGREGDLPVIAEGFIDLYRAHKGIEKATVTTAVALTDAQMNVLATKLGQSLDAKIQLEQVVDPNMIGGIRLRVAGKEYNGSVSGKLSGLKKRFKNNLYIADY